MKFWRPCLTILFCLGLCTSLAVSGCGDDEETTKTSWVPDIPKPTNYLDMDVPLESERLYGGEIVLKDFSPITLGAIPLSCNDLQDPFPACIICFPEKYGNYDSEYRRIVLVEDGKIVDNPMSQRVWGCSDWKNEHDAQIQLHPITERPHLRWYRYWTRKPDQCWRISEGSSHWKEWEHQYSYSVTDATSFSKTLNVSASIGAEFKALSATLSAGYSETSGYSHSISVTQVDIITEGVDAKCPMGKNMVFCVWELVDEFDFVDSEGEDFFQYPKSEKNPYYYWPFDSSKRIVPHQEIVTDSTYFDK
jgi:hypothetical protein